MSVNFFFIILGVMELSLPETVIIGCARHWYRASGKPIQPPQAGTTYVQHREHGDGDLLPPVSLTAHRDLYLSHHRADAGGGRVYLLCHQHDAGRDRDLAYGKEDIPQDLVRMLFLVVPLLPGGSGDFGLGQLCQPLRRLANVVAGLAGNLLDLSFLSSLSRATGRRKAARGKHGGAALAHH